MKKGMTELVFILDKSGSMSPLVDDTIGGFNSMIEKQKKEDGEALVSTVLFDSRTTVLYDRLPLDKIEPMTDKQYCPGGSTALLDAVGGAIHHIGNIHKYAREEDVPERTIFVITTDGMENASRMYSLENVKQMIELEKAKYEWEFLFLGANIDAVSCAERLGINRNRAERYRSDRRGMDVLYDCVSETVSTMRKRKMYADENPLGAIRKDYESREGE